MGRGEGQMARIASSKMAMGEVVLARAWMFRRKSAARMPIARRARRMSIGVPPNKNNPVRSWCVEKISVRLVFT